MKLRPALMWIHLVLGLTGAVILAIVAFTGAYITFQDPLFRWLNPVPDVAGPAGPLNTSAVIDSVEARFTPRHVVSIAMRPGSEATVVRLGDRTAVFVNPATGAIIGSRPGRFASLENLTALMRRLHTNLVLGPKGRLLVTAATAEALLLALTGLWLWWRKKHWQFRPWRGSLFRVSWDLHNATGIWFLVPVLSLVLTGLLISMPGPIYRVAGVEPAPWLNPPLSVEPGADHGQPALLPRVLAVADSALPGEVTGLSIPTSPRGAFGVRKGSTTAFVDQHTGALIEVRPDRAPTTGDDAYQVIEDLHTGVLLGAPGRVLMTLGSLMLVVASVTGGVLGVKRVLILAGRLGTNA
jgi:uncharacterized iron-regulated membrane protein